MDPPPGREGTAAEAPPSSSAAAAAAEDVEAEAEDGSDFLAADIARVLRDCAPVAEDAADALLDGARLAGDVRRLDVVGGVADARQLAVDLGSLRADCEALAADVQKTPASFRFSGPKSPGKPDDYDYGHWNSWCSVM